MIAPGMPEKRRPFTVDDVPGLDQLLADFVKLRAFAVAVFKDWPDTPVLDGLELQEMGEKFGLLVGEERTEACGEHCNCVEYGDFPLTCYRRSRVLTDPLVRPIFSETGD